MGAAGVVRAVLKSPVENSVEIPEKAKGAENPRLHFSLNQLTLHRRHFLWIREQSIKFFVVYISYSHYTLTLVVTGT